MNNKNMDFFLSSYTLEHTKRYSMKPVVHAESVATHSFFVSLAVLLMSKEYIFNVDEALKIAICHDLAEMEISDVNHTVKKSHPDVAKALKDAEARIIGHFPTQLQPYCLKYDEQTVEAWVVHLADAVQCMQYASNEIGMGNRGYMEEVLINSTKRVEVLRVKLQPYKVH